jgi:hypothetical protein
LRVYHNKLEDYPQYSTIEELKEDKSFILSAKKVVQEVMLKQIDETEITLDFIKNLFEELRNGKLNRFQGKSNQELEDEE